MMKNVIIFEGICENGKTFRPSDWSERISGILASFGPDHRLHYNPRVRPCIIQGVKCLEVASSLAEEDPDAYAQLLKFARDNHLKIREELAQAC